MVGVQGITTIHSPHPATWPKGEPMRARDRWMPRCPRHKVPLNGGPAHYGCPKGHGVPAADLDHEFHGRPA